LRESLRYNFTENSWYELQAFWADTLWNKECLTYFTTYLLRYH